MASMKSQLCVVLLLVVICTVTANEVPIEEWRELLKDTVAYKEWCNSTTNKAICSNDDNSDICFEKNINLMLEIKKLRLSSPSTYTNVTYHPEICSVEKIDVVVTTGIPTTQNASTSQRSNSYSTNELLDAEGNATPGVPESNESNILYWVLPVIAILLIAMVVGVIYIFRYTRKAVLCDSI